MDILEKAKLMKYCKPGYECPLKNGTITFLDYDNFEGFYFIYEDILYFFFNGSNDVKDWFDNFNTKRTKLYLNNTYCGKVHKGFFNYYENIKSKFMQIIYDNIYCKQIHITGYSLGGSCVIAALDASFLDDCPPINVVTFGSPRIGNTSFANIYKTRIANSYRVVNENDPVVKAIWPIRYTHVEKKYFLPDNEKKNWLKIKHFFTKALHLKCHSMEEYIKKLSF